MVFKLVLRDRIVVFPMPDGVATKACLGRVSSCRCFWRTTWSCGRIVCFLFRSEKWQLSMFFFLPGLNSKQYYFPVMKLDFWFLIPFTWCSTLLEHKVAFVLTFYGKMLLNLGCGSVMEQEFCGHPASIFTLYHCSCSKSSPYFLKLLR